MNTDRRGPQSLGLPDRSLAASFAIERPDAVTAAIVDHASESVLP
jgi:hypothetical protein